MQNKRKCYERKYLCAYDFDNALISILICNYKICFQYLAIVPVASMIASTRFPMDYTNCFVVLKYVSDHYSTRAVFKPLF